MRPRSLLVLAGVLAATVAFGSASALAGPAPSLQLNTGRALAKQFVNRLVASAGHVEGGLTGCYRSSRTRVICSAYSDAGDDITCTLRIAVWTTSTNSRGYYSRRSRSYDAKCSSSAPSAPAPQVPTAPSSPTVPTVPSVPAPTPTASTCGAPSNPWGYTFCGGTPVYSAPSTFCSYFNCIASFWQSTNGYVIQCADGTYSHSGGVQGSCSYHGGNYRPLYMP